MQPQQRRLDERRARRDLTRKVQESKVALISQLTVLLAFAVPCLLWAFPIATVCFGDGGRPCWERSLRQTLLTILFTGQ